MKPVQTDERQKLTLEEAVALMPKGKTIHVFLQSGPMLIGADWSRKAVIALIEKHGAELSGDTATAMKHGIVVITPERPHFIETVKEESGSTCILLLLLVCTACAIIGGSILAEDCLARLMGWR